MYSTCYIMLYNRCCLALYPPSVEPNHSSRADAELQIGRQAASAQCRRCSPNLHLPDVLVDARGDRGGGRLLLSLLNHRTPFTCLVSRLPCKVLRRQGVPDMEARTKADPLPHLEYLPGNNTAFCVQEEQTGGLRWGRHRKRQDGW